MQAAGQSDGKVTGHAGGRVEFHVICLVSKLEIFFDGKTRQSPAAVAIAGAGANRDTNWGDAPQGVGAFWVCGLGHSAPAGSDAPSLKKMLRAKGTRFVKLKFEV